MSLNRKESKARKLAIFAIMLDIITFTLGFGFIFIAIGHDANSSIECTSTNGLCLTTPGPVTAKQAISDSCSIAVGATSCFKIETLAGFSSAPSVSYPTTATAPRTQQMNTTDQGSFFAGSSAGFTWTSMPVAQTEIFGDTTGQHWLHMDGTGFNKLEFVVNCLTGSSSATATLQLQWSTDGGTTWNSIASSINIQAANCPNGSGAVGLGGFSGYATMPSGIQCDLCNGSVPVVYRIVGQNGGGAGDNPVFLSAQINMLRTFNVNNIITFQVGTPLSTSVTITAQVQFPIQGSAFLISWKSQAELA